MHRRGATTATRSQTERRSRTPSRGRASAARSSALLGSWGRCSSELNDLDLQLRDPDEVVVALLLQREDLRVLFSEPSQQSVTLLLELVDLRVEALRAVLAALPDEHHPRP